MKHPFEIHISQSILNDLKNRLEHTRWPDEIIGSDWNYGANLYKMKLLIEYWKTKFDWRKQEKE